MRLAQGEKRYVRSLNADNTIQNICLLDSWTLMLVLETDPELREAEETETVHVECAGNT
jgi:hypothetical protein